MVVARPAIALAAAPPTGNRTHVPLDRWIPALAVCMGSVVLLAMQAGPRVASQPALTLGDAMVSLALGITLHEEHIRSGWWLVPQLFGVALIAAGVRTLSRIPLTKALVAPEEERRTG